MRKSDIKNIDEVIKQYFLDAYYACDSNGNECARLLGISRRCVTYWLKRHGIKNDKYWAKVSAMNEARKIKDDREDENYKRLGD